MNKFLAIIALALACQIAAGSQNETWTGDAEDGFARAAAEHDEKETGLLMGNERLFTDFCLNARSYLIKDFKGLSRDAASALFRQFFNSASEITDEVLSVQQAAVAELAKQLANPAAPIDNSPLPEIQVAELVNKGKREIQERALVAGLFAGARTAISAMVNVANSALFVRLAQARTYVSGDKLIEGIHACCDRVHGYAAKLGADLEAAKTEMGSTNDQPEMKEFLKSITISSLHCQTTKNIARLSGFCELFQTARLPFMKMLGIQARF